MQGRRLVSAVSVLLACGTAALAATTGDSALAQTHQPEASTIAAQDKLPDLTMRPLREFRLKKVNGQPVLRFSTPLVNAGDGPIEILATRPNTRTPHLYVVQRIYQSAGPVRTVPTRAVVRYAVRDGHSHFHVYDFELYRMRPVSSTVWRGSHKEGYCFTDDARVHGKMPKRYSEENWDDCGRKKPASLRVRMGLTPGWEDEYDWALPGQYIDLAGRSLPGEFCVQAIADPHHFFQEKTRRNNTTESLVRITPTTAKVIRQGC